MAIEISQNILHHNDNFIESNTGARDEFTDADSHVFSLALCLAGDDGSLAHVGGDVVQGSCYDGRYYVRVLGG